MLTRTGLMLSSLNCYNLLCFSTLHNFQIFKGFFLKSTLEGNLLSTSCRSKADQKWVRQVEKGQRQQAQGM